MSIMKGYFRLLAFSTVTGFSVSAFATNGYILKDTGASPPAGTADTTSPAFYNTGGNIGIGTTSPAYLLHVQGGAPAINIESINGNGGTTSTLYFGHSQNGYTTPLASIYSYLTCGGSCAAGDLHFSTTYNNAQSDKMIIQAGGNVGIGTATPGAKLTVASGDVAVAGSNGVILKNGSNCYSLKTDASGHIIYASEAMLPPVHNSSLGCP